MKRATEVFPLNIEERISQSPDQVGVPFCSLAIQIHKTQWSSISLTLFLTFLNILGFKVQRMCLCVHFSPAHSCGAFKLIIANHSEKVVEFYATFLPEKDTKVNAASSQIIIMKLRNSEAETTGLLHDARITSLCWGTVLRRIPSLLYPQVTLQTTLCTVGIERLCC